MRASCNGCRVLRKGCSDDCTIRPCLQWIQPPDAQANATLFLAKFYGRTALLNLINAAPHHLRPATFRSLLYEACGRMVDPIYGSSGLLWSGNWNHCQAAVDALLAGGPLITGQFDHQDAPYDIRHVNKAASATTRPVRTRNRSKRSGAPSHLSGNRREDESNFSAETMDGSTANPSAKRRRLLKETGGDDEEGLDLTLGLALVSEPKTKAERKRI